MGDYSDYINRERNTREKARGIFEAIVEKASSDAAAGRVLLAEAIAEVLHEAQWEEQGSTASLELSSAKRDGEARRSHQAQLIVRIHGREWSRCTVEGATAKEATRKVLDAAVVSFAWGIAADVETGAEDARRALDAARALVEERLKAKA
ncbi:MAG TPA: hypothetical protein VFS43_35750 [Polyangiaceae bacterium]|nr:hypothetical protein [Polyangiaceae bacterium]